MTGLSAATVDGTAAMHRCLLIIPNQQINEILEFQSPRLEHKLPDVFTAHQTVLSFLKYFRHSLDVHVGDSSEACWTAVGCSVLCLHTFRSTNFMEG